MTISLKSRSCPGASGLTTTFIVAEPRFCFLGGNDFRSGKGRLGVVHRVLWFTSGVKKRVAWSQAAPSRVPLTLVWVLNSGKNDSNGGSAAFFAGNNHLGVM